MGTSNAYSTIWLADVARLVGGHLSTLEPAAGKGRCSAFELGVAGFCSSAWGSFPGERPIELLVTDNATSPAPELEGFLAAVESRPQWFALTLPIGNEEQIAKL